MAYEDDDYSSVGLLDDEEQARKRASLAQPVPPPTETTQAPAKPAQSITGPSEPATQPTSITAGPLDTMKAPGTGPLDVAKQPAAPLGPAGQREATLLGQGPPQYHGVKKVLDVLGRVTGPGAAIEQRTGLGTLGYESRLGEAAHAAELEQKQAKAPLDLAYEQAHTAQQQSLAEQESARAKALANPPAKPPGKPAPQYDKTGNLIGFIDKDGDLIGPKSPKLTPDMKDMIEAAQPKAAPLNDFEKYYKDFLTDNKFPDTAHNRLLAREHYAAAGQAPQRPERPQRTMVAVPQPDGSSKVIEVNPGDVIPKGAETVSEFGKEKKATADEQRRADLANNLTENLDKLEEIVKRRPDLFGPGAGRLTSLKQWAGSSDPDVAALATIKEQTGMAMVGAHAMRNAQHVEAAANSIMNAYKNEPEALLGPRGSIAAARSSLKTFTQDVERAKGNQSATADTGGGKTYSQQDVDDAAKQYGKPAAEIDAAFKKKGYTKK